MSLSDDTSASTLPPPPRPRAGNGEELIPDTSSKQIRALTNDEIARAMEHVSDTYAPIITVVAETGLRISEVLGITWGVLDLELEVLSVEGQLGSDGTLRKRTKNKLGRVIPISARCAATLRELRRSMQEGGYRTGPEALVFVTRTGLPQSRRNVLRAWQTALETVGIEGAGLHSAAALVRLAADRGERPGHLRAEAGRALAGRDDDRPLRPPAGRRRRADREAPQRAVEQQRIRSREARRARAFVVLGPGPSMATPGNALATTSLRRADAR